MYHTTMTDILAADKASRSLCSSSTASAGSSPASNVGRCAGESSPRCSPITSHGKEEENDSSAAGHSNTSSFSDGPRKMLKVSSPSARAILSSPSSGGGGGCSMEKMKDEILQMAYDRGGLKFGSFTLKSGRKSPFFFNSGCFSDGKAMDLLSRAYALKIVESQIEFDVLFGPAYKGIPLVACTAMLLSREYGMASPFLYDRKQPKDHGEGGEFVGAVEALRPKRRPTTADNRSNSSSSSNSTAADDSSSSSTSAPADESSTQEKSDERSGDLLPARVIVLDDVLTAGTAIRSSMAKLHAEFSDVQVAALCLLLDREECVNIDSPVCASEQLKREMNVQILSVLRMQDILEFLDGLVAAAATEEAKAKLEEARRDLRIYLKTFSRTHHNQQPDNASS